MVKNNEKRERIGSETRGKLEDDVDALFKLPLAEFTGARNKLAAWLKQSGHANDATLVKALGKPSISAWAVNQLYWKHREPFDKLLAAGQRFRQSHASGLTGTVADMRGSLNAQRDVLSQLSDLAASLLRDSGHSPTPEMLRRITTTLEALSALASLSDGPTPGRLTDDVDPPGFEALASLVPGSPKGTKEPARLTVSQKPNAAATKVTPIREVRQAEATRRAKIVAAKDSLQAAKKSLIDSRAKAQRLEAAQKKASAEAKEAEKQRREAEERFRKAGTASEAANQNVRSLNEEAREAAKAIEDAKLAVAKASKELESLVRE